MAEHPLLVFPEPATAERARRFGGGGRIRVPDVTQQAERLVPQFTRLQEAMEQKRIALQSHTLGIQPEQVLVLETFGSIENFVNAIRRIEGLEWLGEYEDRAISPEFGFEYEGVPDRQMSGQIFLVMTDQEALRQLQSFFDQWQENEDATFPYGLAKLKQAFAHLRRIRPWDAEDRIRDTGILEDWQFRIESGEDLIPFEAEFWFRGNRTRQLETERELQSIIESEDGEIVQRCLIPEIGYHAILARIPSAHIREIVDHPDVRANVRLLQWDGIRFIRPVGQCTVLLPDELDPVSLQEEEELQAVDTIDREPLVAVLDGLPLAGHHLLVDRIVIDDPDDFESDYQAHERRHGTAMASLICHGDLNESGQSLNRVIYARPIMKPKRGFNGQFVESIPDDVLPVDLVHRAVRRCYTSIIFAGCVNRFCRFHSLSDC